MKTLVLVAALLPFAAFATTKPDDAPHATANADAEARADSESAATGIGEVKVEVAPTQALTFERSAATAYSPDIYPTAPCVNGWSVGGAATGGGFSFGKGRELPDCVNRELIRIAAQMGMAAQARFMWCSQAPVLAVFGNVEACLAYEPAKPEPTVTVQCSTERQERIESALTECLGKH